MESLCLQIHFYIWAWLYLIDFKHNTTQVKFKRLINSLVHLPHPAEWSRGYMFVFFWILKKMFVFFWIGSSPVTSALKIQRKRHTERDPALGNYFSFSPAVTTSELLLLLLINSYYYYWQLTHTHTHTLSLFFRFVCCLYFLDSGII